MKTIIHLIGKGSKNDLIRELMTKFVLEIPSDLAVTTVTVYCIAIPSVKYDQLLHSIKLETPEIVHTPEKLFNLAEEQKFEEVIHYYFELAKVPFTLPLSYIHILGMVNCTFQINNNNFEFEYSLIKQDLEKTLEHEFTKEIFEKIFLVKKIKAMEKALMAFQFSFYKLMKIIVFVILYLITETFVICEYCLIFQKISGFQPKLKT